MTSAVEDSMNKGEDVEKMDPRAIESEQDCAICMEVLEMTKQHEVQAKELPCHHIFHKTCVDKWLKKHNTCPLCRFDVWSTEVDRINWYEDDDDDDEDFSMDVDDHEYIYLDVDQNAQEENLGLGLEGEEGNQNVQEENRDFGMEREEGNVYYPEELEDWDFDMDFIWAEPEDWDFDMDFIWAELEDLDMDITPEEQVILGYLAVDTGTAADEDNYHSLVNAGPPLGSDASLDADSQVNNDSYTTPHVDEDDQDCDMDNHDRTSAQTSDNMRDAEYANDRKI